MKTAIERTRLILQIEYNPNPDMTNDRTSCVYEGCSVLGLCTTNGAMCNDDKLMKSYYSVHTRMHIISVFFSNWKMSHKTREQAGFGV